MKTVLLKKPPQGSLRPGHPWVYKNQIQKIADSVSPGDIVDVSTESGRILARGYWNPRSEISVRLMVRDERPVDAALVRSLLEKAVRFRERVVRDTDAYRVVNSEADGLPGLIVDRYADVLVVQFLTLGMEKMRDWVLEALDSALPNRGVFERSDAPSRKLEGLTERTGWIRRDCGDEVVVRERDIQMALRFGEGHKTGMYLDQRENRLALRDWQKGGRVLDAFCYEAAFGLHLAKNGCRVTSVDAQTDAIERAKEHRRRNGLEENLELRVGNVFDVLKEYEKEKTYFDLIILDPPSFAKQKSALAGALSGYREILLRSMKLLNDEGSLAVFSCAYHVDENLLMQSCLRAALDSKKALRVLKFLKQSSDHPIDPFIPETYYLKGFLLQAFSQPARP
jgi:23S rRNA (cytosine1962-C5)-methyltransferase